MARHTPAITPRAVRRTLRTQLAAALAQLKERTPSDEHIHSARKCIKKARATQRLLRDVLGTPTYRRENQALRDAARPLSAARDAKVVIDVLDAMVERRRFDEDAASALRRALIRDRDRSQRQVRSRAGVAHSRRGLRAVDRRASQWPMTQAEGKLLIRALRRVYRRGRRALESASVERTAECLHEWRKQVKYLWHVLQLLEPLPPDIEKMAETAHALSDYLGEDHDLAVLRDTVRSKARLFNRRSLKSTLDHIQKRQQALQRKAFASGRRLFKEEPASFARRFKGRVSD